MELPIVQQIWMWMYTATSKYECVEHNSFLQKAKKGPRVINICATSEMPADK